MSLRLRALRLRVLTEGQTFGADLTFPDGLVILRGDNSAGKSTCVQAAVYALGLEGMFGPSRDVPLPHAMTDRIEWDGEMIPVSSSEVIVEIENGTGDRLTARRSVKGGPSRELIAVLEGAGLSQSPNGDWSDYYVRRAGAATRDRGFHRRLADFIGWSLPKVLHFDGTEGPLYLEALFPLFYVEQKKGWSAIDGRFPTHLGIREVAARAIEFTLALDAYGVAIAKAELAKELQAGRAKWAEQLRLVATLAREVGGTVRNIPSSPISAWPPRPSVEVVVFENEAWTALDAVAAALRERLEGIQVVEVQLTREAAPESEALLRTLSDELATKDRDVREVTRALQAEHGEVDSIRIRLEALEEDISKNTDAVTLQKLGSVRKLTIAANICPTCHQSITGSLIAEAQPSIPVMPVEDNLAYLKEQRGLYETLRGQAEQALQTRHLQLQALEGQTRVLRDRIRALKETLTSDPRLPSRSQYEERIRLEARVKTLGDAAKRIEAAVGVFAELSAVWREVVAREARLPKGRHSAVDELKLARFEELVQAQLGKYGMESVPPSGILISRENYRPTYGGFDLQFDLSASDTIRTIWAVRLGMLELAREYQDNHPGFLVFDEPRQQEAAIESLRQFLARALTCGAAGQQVLVLTSEPMTAISAHLGGAKAHVIDFKTRILAPLKT